MLNLEQIQNYYSPQIRENPAHQKYIVKEYIPKFANVSHCGFFFSFPVPPDDVLCAMKLSALLSRAKGRDFYDALFLLSQTEPNYNYLTQKHNIHNLTELKIKITEIMKKVDLLHKSKDFEHLLFNKINKERILNFSELIRSI